MAAMTSEKCQKSALLFCFALLQQVKSSKLESLLSVFSGIESFFSLCNLFHKLGIALLPKVSRDTTMI